MIIANRNDRPLVRLQSFAFRAVPGPGEFAAIAPGAGTVFYTPNRSIMVVNYGAWADIADPFVAAGGATTVALTQFSGGGTGGINWRSASGIAVWNTPAALMGGYGVYGGTGPLAASGVLMAPLGTVDPARPAAGGILSAVCDAGTVTGTLWLELHFYYNNARAVGLP